MVMNDNFCFPKVGRGITKWGAIEKGKIFNFDYFTHFEGTNNIFVDFI